MAHLRPAEVLLTADQIQRRIADMANDIHRDFPHGVHFVAVLKGAFMFLADLVRQVPGDVSYGVGPRGDVNANLDNAAAKARSSEIEVNTVDLGIGRQYIQRAACRSDDGGVITGSDDNPRGHGQPSGDSCDQRVLA